MQRRQAAAAPPRSVSRARGGCRRCENRAAITSTASSLIAPASSTPVGPSAHDDEGQMRRTLLSDPPRVSAVSNDSSRRERMNVASSTSFMPGAQLVPLRMTEIIVDRARCQNQIVVRTDACRRRRRAPAARIHGVDVAQHHEAHCPGRAAPCGSAARCRPARARRRRPDRAAAETGDSCCGRRPAPRPARARSARAANRPPNPQPTMTTPRRGGSPPASAMTSSCSTTWHYSARPGLRARRSMAARLRSTSASLVAQLHTLMRMAVRPCQTVPPHQHVPSSCMRRDHAPRLRSGSPKATST